MDWTKVGSCCRKCSTWALCAERMGLKTAIQSSTKVSFDAVAALTSATVLFQYQPGKVASHYLLDPAKACLV